MYASIRQGKAKPGMAEELTRRIKEGEIPIKRGLYGLLGSLCTRRHRDSDQYLQRFCGSRRVEQVSAGVDRAKPCAAARWTSYGDCRAGDRPYFGVRRSRTTARRRRTTTPAMCASRRRRYQAASVSTCCSRLNDPFARGSGQIGSDGLKGRGLLRVPAKACSLAAPGKGQPVGDDSLPNAPPRPACRR